MIQDWINKTEVEFEGMTLVLSSEPIREGDTYLAERNTGPKLLTAKNINGAGRCIHAKENAYSFDLCECKKVVDIR